VRRHAQPAGVPSAPVESVDRSVGGVEAPRGPQHPCWRALMPQRQVRRGPGWPGLPPRTEFFAVGDAHEVVVPRGLEVQAPEPDFKSGWEGVRAAHRIPLAAVLGANHHREGWRKLIFSAIPPYLARQLLVRNVVPTLTSNERWDQPLDGPVLATKDTGFILVPAGVVRPAVVCSKHCIVLHRGARRGGLQAWRERRPGLQVSEVLIEASANIVVKAESVL
jgi:hypothetical protein